MALSAIGGGFGSSLFQQSNREIHQLGGRATQAKMDEVKAVIGDSKFGSSTKAGTSEFQQTQRTVIRTGEQSASRATHQAAQNMDPAMLGTSAFQKSLREAQQYGAQATSQRMEQAKAAYAISPRAPQHVGSNLDIKA